MTVPVKSLVGAAVAALVGTMSLNAGYLLRDLAHAEQEVAAQQTDRADETFARAERYFEQMSRIPGVSGAWLNDIRTRRASLKRDLKAGRVHIHGLLLDPPEYLETAKVFDLLLAVPKYGRVKVNRILTQCRISPSKTVGGLSERQRGELVSFLRR